MRTYLGKRKLFWLKDLLSGARMWRNYRDVLQIMSNPENSENLQKRRLNDILNYAKSHTRFYSGISGKTLRDFPVVNKNIIREVFDDFIVGDKGNYIRHITSGSTGTPFIAYQDRLSNIRRIATIKASNEGFGFHSCMSMLYLRSLEIPEKDGSLLRYEKGQNIWYCYIPSYDDATLSSVIDLIFDRHIQFVKGYASLIDRLTDFMDRKGILLPRNLIFITISEILTENVRSRIVNKLGLHVVSQYANEENGLLGQSVLDGPGNVFILNKANCIMELLALDSNEPAIMGQPGRVVLTDLTNKAMPLIRYDIGDVAICLQTLPSGEPLVIQLLEFRHYDMIYNTSGIPIPMAIPPEIWAIPSLLQVQFIQEDVKKYVLNINTKLNADESVDCEYLTDVIKGILGQDAIVVINLVNGLPELSTHKHKLCLQRCNRYL